MQIETRLSDQIARYLDLSVGQTKLTAVNMANVDTPGYRAIGMNFNAEMRQAMVDVDNESGPHSVQMELENGLVARPDGNNVSMEREGLTLAEAQLKFKTGVALMRLENQRVMDAIHADSK
jgi:flagellar basal-body rod protein FlgB